MAKITIIKKREYKTKGDDGKTYEGFAYSGFTEKGKLVEFTSPVSTHEVVLGAVEFEADNAVDLNLEAKTYQGVLKGFREIVEQGDGFND